MRSLLRARPRGRGGLGQGAPLGHHGAFPGRYASSRTSPWAPSPDPSAPWRQASSRRGRTTSSCAPAGRSAVLCSSSGGLPASKATLSAGASPRGKSPALSAFALGVAAGLNVCPPFIAAAGRAAALGVLGGAAYFALFFVGTSAWMLPLSLLPRLQAPRPPEMRAVARIAMIMLGPISSCPRHFRLELNMSDATISTRHLSLNTLRRAPRGRSGDRGLRLRDLVLRHRRAIRCGGSREASSGRASAPPYSPSSRFAGGRVRRDGYSSPARSRLRSLLHRSTSSRRSRAHGPDRSRVTADQVPFCHIAITTSLVPAALLHTLDFPAQLRGSARPSTRCSAIGS